MKYLLPILFVFSACDGGSSSGYEEGEDYIFACGGGSEYLPELSIYGDYVSIVCSPSADQCSTGGWLKVDTNLDQVYFTCPVGSYIIVHVNWIPDPNF